LTYLDEEAAFAATLVKVCVSLDVVDNLFEIRCIRALGEDTLLVQVAKDAVLALDDLNAGLVVVVRHVFPLDVFLAVLFLLGLEGQLDKDLFCCRFEILK